MAVNLIMPMLIITKEIIEQLNKELALPYTGTEQDWEIQMADAGRIDEFIKFYRQPDLLADKKVAVMALIVASFDDFLNEHNLDVARWNQIKSMLESDRVLFADLIDYWSLNDELHKGDGFKITPLMRSIK